CHYKVDTCIELISLLTKHGADINGKTVDGDTPLTCAIRYSRDNIASCLKLVSLLIEHGADIRQKSKSGITPLMTAVQYATRTDIVKLVLGDEDNVNSTDDDGLSACRYCFKRDYSYPTKKDYRTTLTIFQLLVESGANIVSNGVKLLHDILTLGNLQIFEYYIGLKSPVGDATDQTNKNIFHLLAQVKYKFTFDKFNWLFGYGVDINHTDYKSNTPVIIAGYLINNIYLELLTKQGRVCDVNIQNKLGHTALHAAVIACSYLNRQYKQAEIAELKRNVSNEKLKEKSQTDRMNAFKTLPGLQQNIPLTDSLQNNLHVNYKAFNECVDILVNAGGDVNIQDSDGKTALMLAAEINDTHIINKLLDVGADRHIVDYKHGSSALQFLDLGFGQKCLTLLLDKDCRYLLNLPNRQRNRLIQRMLLFPWPQSNHNTSFIRYLIAENCCLQHLQSSSTQTNHYNEHVTLENFNSEKRHKLRQLLYRSGAPKEEIVSVVNFKMEDKARTTDEALHSPNRERFDLFCFSLTLKEKCVRIIRQHIGLDIKRKVEQLDISLELKDDVFLIHYIPKRYFHDNIDDVFKDDDILDSRDEDGFIYDDRHMDINSFIPQTPECNDDNDGQEDGLTRKGFSRRNVGNGVYNYKYYEMKRTLEQFVKKDEEELSTPS
ncbi:putative ankyrin repeat protein RF_0381, partial [Patella vulgata]|uniref:putative ankyrin repeat protein RF_0381 n=1 Tax=Patella vulgata TaxID=6465 RepID=UPI0024A8F396